MIRKTLIGILLLLIVALGGLFAWGYAPDIPPEELRAKYANDESEFVELDDGMTVHLRDEGPEDAPAIILLHGSNASLLTWDQWTEKLKQSYRVIRFDQAGHGLTGPHPDGCYSAECFAETVDNVAANRGLETFYLGGNSMGGWITHAYAGMHPEKLSGTILVNAGGAPENGDRELPLGFRVMLIPGIREIATVFTPRSIIARSLRQSVSNQDVVTEAEIDEYWDLQRYPGNRQATIDRFSRYEDRDTSMDTARNIPAMIIWGDEDKLIPVAAAQWFERQYPEHKTHIYPGVGHLPMEETPETSVSDLIAWLDKQRETDASAGE